MMKRLSVLVVASALLVSACGDSSPTPPPGGGNPAPTISSTSPANISTGAPRNVAVTAVFSAVMTPATINSTTFVLRQGAVVVVSGVSYAGATATLIPATTLAANTVYTATVTTGVRSALGTAMATERTWSFTTVNSSVTGPQAVNLGTAANFAVLAKSAISTTGAGSVTGNLGLSPAAATFITGFALTLDASNTFATSAMVTGQIRASNYAPPTPATMTTAVADMETAYTNAAGRTLPDFTELGAGNISGMNLVPGLYKWGTGVTIPSAVTLTGGANDVWIFQIAQNLTVANGTIVTLAGGAQARNIFWQVAGQATLGTTSNFKGIILSQTLISFNTGAIFTGRALAQTAVTMNATAVTNP